MAGALAVLIAIALVIKFGGGAAARLAEQQLAGQNLVAGSITYEKIMPGSPAMWKYITWCGRLLTGT